MAILFQRMARCPQCSLKIAIVPINISVINFSISQRRFNAGKHLFYGILYSHSLEQFLDGLRVAAP